MLAQMCAQHDVFAGRHIHADLQILERPTHPPPRQLLGG
ncbi:hypothetical protein D558_0939 [Bordetella holmesii 44057]|nr:hypothetical protein D558_0939 [Bordetella holmesii 44057]